MCDLPWYVLVPCVAVLLLIAVGLLELVIVLSVMAYHRIQYQRAVRRRYHELVRRCSVERLEQQQKGVNREA